MKRERMRWEKHGDIMRLIDGFGWTRALLWLEGSLYYAVSCLGLAGAELREFSAKNKLSLMRTAVDHVRKQKG